MPDCQPVIMMAAGSAHISCSCTGGRTSQFQAPFGQIQTHSAAAIVCGDSIKCNSSYPSTLVQILRLVTTQPPHRTMASEKNHMRHNQPKKCLPVRQAWHLSINIAASTHTVTAPQPPNASQLQVLSPTPSTHKLQNCQHAETAAATTSPAARLVVCCTVWP